MAIQNLYQIDYIQRKISILEMIEKIKNCGLVWRQHDVNSWTTQHNDGEDVWDLMLTKVSDSESNGDKQIKYDVVFLDFKKNDSHFYTLNSNNESYLSEMWEEITGDIEFEREEKLLRDLHVISKFKELNLIKHVARGGLVAGSPAPVSIYNFVPESKGLKASAIKVLPEQILPNYQFKGPRRLAVYGDKVFVTSDHSPVCSLDANQNYIVSGTGWINVITGSLKNQEVVPVTNRVIALPIACANIAVSKNAEVRKSSNFIGSSPNIRSKVYTSGLYGQSVVVANADKLTFEKFIYTGYQTTSMCMNQNLNLLYVAQTRMNINNQVWRFDLPYGPPHPPTDDPVGLPVIPPSIASGPPFELADIPVGVQNTPGQSYITIISTVTDEILTSIDMGEASFNDMVVDYNTNYLFVADAGEDRVLVLDPLQNYKLIKEIKTGLLPVGMELYKNNLYVINNESKTISVFDIGQGDFSLISTIGLINRPLRMKINSRTSMGYVTIFGEYNAYDSRVAIIDLKRNKVIGYYVVGFGPYDLDLDTSSEKMYVSCYLSNFVSTINLKDTFTPIE
jgi:DNA-binding beta-propeller fold protein YncE